jgi:hypothetical protein
MTRPGTVQVRALRGSSYQSSGRSRPQKRHILAAGMIISAQNGHGRREGSLSSGGFGGAGEANVQTIAGAGEANVQTIAATRPSIVRPRNGLSTVIAVTCE